MRTAQAGCSPATGGINITELFTNLSKRTLDITRFTSENPVLFQLTPGQWQSLNERFTRLLRETNAFFGAESLSSIKRRGAILFRIAMTLTTCRGFENADVSTTATCDKADFEIASMLVEAYLQHALFLFEKLPGIPPLGGWGVNQLPNHKRQLFQELSTNFNGKKPSNWVKASA